MACFNVALSRPSYAAKNELFLTWENFGLRDVSQIEGLYGHIDRKSIIFQGDFQLKFTA